MMIEYISLSGTMFGLGVMHALDPSHGKVMLGSYLVNRGLKVRELVFFGLFVAIMQTVFLALLGLILATVSHQLWHEVMDRFADALTGLAFLVMGILMFVHQYKHHHESACCHTEHSVLVPVINGHANLEKTNTRDLFILSLIWGLIPCPIAITALLTGLSTHNWLLGTTSLLIFALGVASIMITSGLCFLYGSHFIQHKLSTFEPLLNRLSQGFALLFIVVGGILVIQAALNQESFLEYLSKLI